MDTKQTKKQAERARKARYKYLKGKSITYNKYRSLVMPGMIITQEIIPELQKPSNMGNNRLTVTDVRGKRYTVKIYYNRSTGRYEPPRQREYSSSNSFDAGCAIVIL